MNEYAPKEHVTSKALITIRVEDKQKSTHIQCSYEVNHNKLLYLESKECS